MSISLQKSYSETTTTFSMLMKHCSHCFIHAILITSYRSSTLQIERLRPRKLKRLPTPTQLIIGLSGFQVHSLSTLIPKQCPCHTYYS